MPRKARSPIADAPDEALPELASPAAHANRSGPPGPAERHGPRGPSKQLWGFDRLRRVMKVSADPDIREVAEWAADELERLRVEVTSLRRRAALDTPSSGSVW